MIFEALISLFCKVVLSVIDIMPAFDMLGPVYTILNGFSAFTGYAAYIVGRDLLLISLGSVAFWWGLKASWGLIVYLWKLLPLT